jgi:hypothetical protein
MVAHREVEVRVLCQSRQPNLPERLPTSDLVSRSDPEAIAAHMAVLSLPPVLVPDHDTVPALLARYPLGPALTDRYIRNTVSRPQHTARSCRENLGVLPCREESEICTVVPVIGPRSASVIARGC